MQVHEEGLRVGLAQEVSVATPEGRAREHRRAPLGLPLSCPRRQRLEPRPPVLVGQRPPRRHLLDVRLRVVGVPLGEGQSQAVAQPLRHDGLAAARDAHHHDVQLFGPRASSLPPREPPRSRMPRHAQCRLHHRPGLQRGLHVHPEEPADQPEAGVVHVGEHRGPRRDGEHQQGDLQVAEVLPPSPAGAITPAAVVSATVADPCATRSSVAIRKACTISEMPRSGRGCHSVRLRCRSAPALRRTSRRPR